MVVELSQLEQDPVVRVALERAFDVQLDSGQDIASWLTVKGPESFEPFAAEGAGGVYFRGVQSGRILFASSEGQAGVIADSLAEFLQILIALPHWQDLLKFSGGGLVEEMRRVHPYLEGEAPEFAQDIEECRRTLLKALALSPLTDPISLLHRRVLHGGADISVLGSDGSEFSSLFNRFTLDDNPSWKTA